MQPSFISEGANAQLNTAQININHMHKLKFTLLPWATILKALLLHKVTLYFSLGTKILSQRSPLLVTLKLLPTAQG